MSARTAALAKQRPVTPALIMTLLFVARDTPASTDSEVSEPVTVQPFPAYRDGTENGVGTGMRFSAAGRHDCRLPANPGGSSERR